MTAQEISKEVSLSITPVDGLKEVSLGELEGITGQEMRTRYADIYAAWREDPSDVVFPGGESMRELQERAWGAVRELLNRHGDDVLVAVSHNFGHPGGPLPLPRPAPGQIPHASGRPGLHEHHPGQLPV